MHKVNKNAQLQHDGVKFSLVRLYTRDISLEAPHVTSLATKELLVEEDKLTLEPTLNFNYQELKDKMFEITAHLKLVAKSNENLLYLIEVQQVAIFYIDNVDVEGGAMTMLKQLGPSIIFPHLSELIANLSFRTSMPTVDLTNMLRISANQNES